jgi:hypothetical protein
MDMSEDVEFQFNLDVRQTLTEVDNLMDDALLLGYNSLRIEITEKTTASFAQSSAIT